MKITSSLQAVPSGATYLEKAIVINNNDPDGIGRCQVRNVNRHGTNENGIKDEDLPWAVPCSFGGGFDSGSSVVPEEGVKVWISYENGDITKPVMLGCVRTSGNSQVSYQGTSSQKRYHRANTSDVPDDYTSPDVKVVYKSPSGSKIVMDDTPGQATINVEDPTGQGLFINPGVEAYSIQNKGFKFDEPEEQRKQLKGSQVILSSNGGNSVNLTANDKKTKVDIVSGASEDEAEINITSQAGKKSTMNIGTSEGENSIINIGSGGSSKASAVNIFSGTHAEEEGKDDGVGSSVNIASGASNKGSSVNIASGSYIEKEEGAEGSGSSINLASGTSSKDSSVNLMAGEAEEGSNFNISTSKGKSSNIKMSTGEGEEGSKVDISSGKSDKSEVKLSNEKTSISMKSGDDNHIKMITKMIVGTQAVYMDADTGNVIVQSFGPSPKQVTVTSTGVSMQTLTSTVNLTDSILELKAPNIIISGGIVNITSPQLSINAPGMTIGNNSIVAENFTVQSGGHGGGNGTYTPPTNIIQQITE